MCESEFLRSFFRSNLSNSSIAIANDSNSPNRLVNAKTTNIPKRNGKKKAVNKKLLSDSKPDSIQTCEPELLKVASAEDKTKSDKSPSLKSESESSVISSQSTLKSGESQQESNPDKIVNTPSQVSTKPTADANTNKPAKPTSQQQVESANSSRSNSINPAIANHGSQQMPNQALNYYNMQANMFNQSQMQPQQQHSQSYPHSINQQLHLHTFQPISNMIIASPPCASPTAAQTTNPHSLNNSRSNSPWMMMPPPLPPMQGSNLHNSSSMGQQMQSMPNGQQYYQPHPHQQYHHHNPHHPQHVHPNMRSNSSNKKDSKHFNSQDEVKAAFILFVFVFFNFVFRL